MRRDVYLKVENPGKLETKCLMVIAKNFDAIVPDCGSEMNLRCLQRRSHLLMKAARGKDRKPVPLQCALWCLPHIKELHLNWFENCNQFPIVRTLGAVESALTVLNARYVSSSVLDQLLPVLPETLKCFDLENSCVTDNGMKIISNRCYNLEELNLNYCNNFSDWGLKTLCHKDERGNIRQNLVLRVLKLKFVYTVTTEGVRFVLHNCPNLSELTHNHVLTTIFQKYSRAVSSNNLENEARYNFKIAHVYWGNPCYDYLKSLSVLCPFISKLEIPIDSQVILNTVAEFPSLTEVQFFIEGPCDFFPFLEARGQNLTILEIYFNFESISSEMVVKFCPRLERLLLTEPKFVKGKAIASPSTQDILTSLTELHINRAHPDYLEESLMYVLSRSPSLEKFTFLNATDRTFVSSSFVKSLVSCKTMSTLKEVEMGNVDIGFAELQDAFQNLNRCGAIL